ncbi:Golgi Transport [Bulinus truncatus]|nr:Golgi Transport [Bulinus truncatus]
MADSVFKDVESAPPIQVFLLTKLFNESSDPNKVNLGVGAYRTEEGKPWVLPVVRAAEIQMASDETLNHEYLPVAGLPDFRQAASRLMLGSGHKLLAEGKVESYQALGGTGALRLGAAFLKNVMKLNVVYISDPTWAYRTEEGKLFVVYPVVRAAEIQMASDETLNHEYLPVAGLPDFRQAASRLMLGSGHKLLAEGKVESYQALGGTGALRLGAAFLKNVMKLNVVYISDPTWENHRSVFQAAGFTDVRQYRYWDSETRGLNFAGMCEDLSNAPANAVILLHGVAHNPTGVDPTREQWSQIAQICKEKKLFVFVDCAYQGFASGSLDEDGWATRFLADQDIDMFVAQSFSKNFGLYNERVGNLVVITRDPKKLTEIRSQMEIQIRVMWSNPPNHGGRIVATVLNNGAFFDEWKSQILTMANRIKKMRQELLDNLKKLGTPGNWDHITKQIGMFSYTGLTEKQVEYLKSKSIYLLSSGRISMCGLTSKNVAYVAKTMDEAIRAYPSN